MIVLTRGVGEKLMIGDDVTVTVTVTVTLISDEHQQINLGINAPKDVSVHREEIYEYNQAEGHQRNDTN